ncbi:MAG: GNAT family N-acetyltransferase [Flavobacterium sp. BFFFF1]|uniref:GNAT family N-acetyltransferase n=1 Tax=Flavobacterium sp. BFFFF1 TaxID=2015557 RepID=UPI000BC545DC|nr:MAG: GNAT family N-acetyltransferase [Flavobacterium sp. BFFFF1]
MDDFNINEEKKRFELKVDNHIAFIEYILSTDNTMFLTHTEVPHALEGKGVGSRIVERTLFYITDHGYKLAPLCPFVAKYLTRHPEFQAILALGYHVG